MIERYIGGGKLFYTPLDGAEVEIGEVKDVTLQIEHTYADAYSKDSGVEKQVDKVAISTKATLAFTTQNVNKTNMAMAMFGTETTETFAIGDTLPDGTVAAAETIIPVIEGGTISKIVGAYRFVAENVTDGDNPVLMVPQAFTTPDGNARDYLAKEHGPLKFKGDISEVNNMYFKEYFMPKGA